MILSVIGARPIDVRFTPKSGHWLSASGRLLCAKSRHFALRGRQALFDHLVGASEERWWHGETERSGGLQIDDQLKFGGLLNR